jgi:hypothetical protein
MPINTLNIQLQNKGFGSYLTGIVPDDIALAAGAFSASMSQVKNISNLPVEKFAQIASNMETASKNLPSINGSSIPTNLALARSGLPIIAKGNGPQNTYTMSNFLGCMSGLPYNNDYKIIKDTITEIETSYGAYYPSPRGLYQIYREDYLAITWAPCTGHLNCSAYNVLIQNYVPCVPTTTVPPHSGPPCVVGTNLPRIDDWYYVIDGIVTDSIGGGYCREGAPVPIVTIVPNDAGASFASSVDTNDNNVPGGFGRASLSMISPGVAVKYATTSVFQFGPPATPAIPVPVVRVECPPTSMTGVNTPAGTAGWPGMNTIVQTYINEANAEILKIQADKPTQSLRLNEAWNDTGIQLNFEQRARTIGLPNLPPQFSATAAETNLSVYPVTQYTFTDSMPNYGLNTEPHMYAQTIEAITNYNTTGGQSMVGLQRESRNQARLSKLGIELDNNIPNKLTRKEQSQLIANGSLPTTITQADTTVITITPPANLVILDPVGNIVTTTPVGVYEPVTGQYIIDRENVSNVAPFPPGGIDNNHYPNIVDPNLNVFYISNTVIPSGYTVAQAIDEVIRCNCDCWSIV